MLSQTAAPILLGLAAAVVWGGADFTGGIAAKQARPGSVVFVAHGTSLLLLVLLILLTHPGPLTGFNQLWGLLSGAAGGFALMFFYEALSAGAMGLSAALAGVLTAALPVGVALVREGRPSGSQIAGFGVAAVAIGLIAWPAAALDGLARSTSLRSLVLATIGGFGFGLQLVVLHLASAHGSVLRALTLSRIGGTASGAAVVLFSFLRRGRRKVGVGSAVTPSQRLGVKAGGGRWTAFLVLATLTGLLDAAGNGLYMGAALVGRMDVAAVLASLYPGATMLLAAWLLKERTTRLQAAGMGLALIAVALISI